MPELNDDSCVLMFSGGRDSTLAAVKLAQGANLTLVTVSSNHLTGRESVIARLTELSNHLPANTRWINVEQPLVFSSPKLSSSTCLPCHHDYISIGTAVAKKLGATALAIGYTSYQSSWAEQTSLATKSLGELLNRHGFSLRLPAYSLSSKEDAIRELARLGLTATALEQKCVVQQKNLALSEDELQDQVAAWIFHLDTAIQNRTFDSLKVVADRLLAQT